MDLTRVLPTFEAVDVGGTRRLVWPLRLRDVAALQAFVRARCPSPLDSALDEIASAGLTGRARQRRLAEAYEACEVWPPRYGSPEAAEHLDSEAGILFFLSVVADRSGWTREDLDHVLASIGPGDYRRIQAAAFQADPLDRLSGLMGLYDQADDEAPRKDLNWGEAFREAAELTGWTFDQLGDLTISQWVAFRTGGASSRTIEVPPGMTAAEAAERQRRKFWGEDLPDADV